MKHCKDGKSSLKNGVKDQNCVISKIFSVLSVKQQLKDYELFLEIDMWLDTDISELHISCKSGLNISKNISDL